MKRQKCAKSWKRGRRLKKKRRERRNLRRMLGGAPSKEVMEAKKEIKKVNGEQKEAKIENPKGNVHPGGVTAEKLFKMMKDQSMSVIIMDARSRRVF
uniref:Uncharacterized protein n=1 Tax=Anguilla anguilla TaxID=7936 RepID=A0A0E9T493_ANGAN